MNILAIDTVSTACSVALMVDDVVVEKRIDFQPNQHSQILLTQVQQVLEESRVTLSNLDMIAVDTGPGSFTGVRIGLGVAQGLAYAINVPLSGFSSLEIMASGMSVGKVVPVLDARMQQVYCALYKVELDSHIEMVAPVVCAPDQIPFEITEEVVLIGQGVTIYYDQLKCYQCELDTKLHYPKAEQLVVLAKREGIRHALNPEQVIATYVRNKVAS